MGKKFKELKIGDTIWYFLNKDRPEEGPKKAEIIGEWELNITGEWKIWVHGERNDFYIFVTKSSMSKSFCSRPYEIYATTEEELLKGSEKFILKRAERLERYMQEAEERVEKFKELRRNLDRLLVSL